MENKGNFTIEGRIVEVRDGSKKIRRTYTYGYRSIRVLVGSDYYSVLVNTSKLNQYGFLPKVGQWIRVTGRLSPSKNGFFDPSISWITQLEHIEPPQKRKIKNPPEEKKDPKIIISNKVIIESLTDQWQNIDLLASELGIQKQLDKDYLNSKLMQLTRKGKIDKLNHRDRNFWKLKDKL